GRIVAAGVGGNSRIIAGTTAAVQSECAAAAIVATTAATSIVAAERCRVFVRHTDAFAGRQGDMAVLEVHDACSAGWSLDADGRTQGAILAAGRLPCSVDRAVDFEGAMPGAGDDDAILEIRDVAQAVGHNLHIAYRSAEHRFHSAQLLPFVINGAADF